MNAPYRSGFCASGRHDRCRGDFGTAVCDCPHHDEPPPGLRIGSLFSGYGGLEQGVQAVLGGTVAWHSDIDPGACKILAHRYPDVPNLGDITTVDWSAVEPVDVLTGGSPCQDLSAAGKRGGMTEGTRSNLWVSMREAIAQLRPSLVVWENVRGAYSACADSELGSCPGCLDERQPHRPLLRAVGRVLGDLASLGFDAEWAGFPASDVGAPHGRFRVFVTAWPADAAGDGPQVGLRQCGGGTSRQERAGHPRRDGRDTVSDASDNGRERAGRARDRRIGPSDGRGPTAHTSSDAGRIQHGDRLPLREWGVYAPAIRRWERLTRPAPSPWMLGKTGGRQLSPRFSEWLMGLPAGWVTDVPGLSRNEQLKALGNGVVPQQAEAALRLLLAAEMDAAA